MNTREAGIPLSALRGSVVGPYRIESPLGGGGMGEVWLATDLRLDRAVAVKRLRGAATPERRARLTAEARAAARLNHPAVAQLFDVIEADGELSLIFEHVAGETIAARLRRGPLPLATALGLAREVCLGLDALHGAGLVHRDLKAENVLLTPAGHAKIVDLGLALALTEDPERLTADGTLLGTYRAMAPEQARGEGVDAKADLFALGVLLVEMLTGTSPFLGRDGASTLARVREAAPFDLNRLAPHLPPRVSELVRDLLARDPAARPESASAVAERLAALAAERSAGGISALETGSFVVQRPRRRPATQRVLAGAALLGVAALSAITLAPVRAPLRVLVLAPEIAGDRELALSASGLSTSLLAGLAALSGVSALDAASLGGPATPHLTLAEQAAAREVLRSRLEPDGALLRITLSRLAVPGGEVLWQESFRAPADGRSLALLAEAVGAHLTRAYPEARPCTGAPALGATGDDFAAFLHLREELEGGAAPTAEHLVRLEALTQSSPRFLAAHLLAGEVALALARIYRSAAELERAAGHASFALALAGEDPRSLALAFQAALARGRLEVAERHLRALEQLLPGSPEGLVRRAELALARGQTASALDDLAAASRLAPTWQNLYLLADTASRHGALSQARSALAELARRAPENPRVKEKAAELELLYGDLKAAEELYIVLLAELPSRAAWSNLGLARYLAGDTAGAIAAYRKALTLDPGHVGVRFNLAEALAAAGEAAEAEALFAGVAASFETARSVLNAQDRALFAQCLARLGRHQDAIALVQAVLAENPDEAEVLYQAAMVYAWAGERVSAEVMATRARAKGITTRWFEIPPWRTP